MKSFSNLTSKKEPIDHKLNSEIFNNKENGFFIELGAYDGIIQSNTLFFEEYKGWTGILIEPSVDMFSECVKNRPLSKCFNYACSNEEKILYLSDRGGLMSTVTETSFNSDSFSIFSLRLDKILKECEVNKIDFLSLDVEGYELKVLEGLDLNIYRPSFMLIELWKSNEENVKKFLFDNHYECICNFTNYNYEDNPGWSGLHNDFLFKDLLMK